jgi:hypothetical protein
MSFHPSRLLIVFFFLIFICTSVGAVNPLTLVYNGSEFQAGGKELVIDLGKTEQGLVCSGVIIIKNNSDQVLQIANVRGSCGLSVPSWPRRNIAPGQEATIQMRYDSSRMGAFSRNLTLNANSNTSVTIIKVQGEIVPRR